MLNRWQRTIVDLRGNVVPYAQLQIRVESTQATATIYADRVGNEIIPNGIVTADANGYAYFYAEADLYRISSAEPTIDWRYVDIGAAGALQRGNNLSDVTNPATARNNLGLGSAAGADVVQSTGSSEHDVMSQKAVTDALNTKANLSQPGTMGLGVGQTWQNVTASRTRSTTYTNTTGRPILISVTTQRSSSSVDNVYAYLRSPNVGTNYLDTFSSSNMGVGFRNSVCSLIQPGSEYGVEVSVDLEVVRWMELR